MVRVVPDVAGIAREFDYVVPPRHADAVDVGTIVRIDLNGRRLAGWVVAVDVEPPPGVELRPIARVTGHGPAPELVELSRWAAWRWAGARRHFLKAASPPGQVVTLPGPARREPADPSDPPSPLSPQIAAVLGHERGVARVAPASDRLPLVLAALRALPPERDGLVLCPSVAEAVGLARRLVRAGVPAVCVAHDQPGRAAAAAWARAAAGGVHVVGARAGAWAPVPRLGRVVVLDEHAEAYQEESAPTWNARDVAVERAARAGVPALLVSPVPSLEALRWGTLEEPSRGDERRGWPHVEVVDRRTEDPTAGLLSDALVRLLRADGRVVCVVNRTGRSRLAACARCQEIVACTVCEGAMAQPGEGGLHCTRCGAERPVVCAHCGSSRLKVLRPGVARLRDEISALVREDVDEVTGATSDPPGSRVVVGTEAALHRVTSAVGVAFLDFDQELQAPRTRGREQALALLARAARLVRSRDGNGRVLIQTRQPDDLVIDAAVTADPGRFSADEDARRAAMAAPPHRAEAVVSGPSAPAFVEALGRPDGVAVAGGGGAWRLQADDHRTLCDALAAVPRPPGRLRIEVDPRRSV